MVWLIGFEFTVHEVLRVEISKAGTESTKKIPKFFIFKGWNLANGISDLNNP